MFIFVSCLVVCYRPSPFPIFRWELKWQLKFIPFQVKKKEYRNGGGRTHYTCWVLMFLVGTVVQFIVFILGFRVDFGYSELCVCSVTQSCLTLCSSMDCILPGSSVHGILQARILGWVATSFSRKSSQPWDQTQISCFGRRTFDTSTTWEAPILSYWLSVHHCEETSPIHFGWNMRVINIA